jgi:DNA mismatch endonuclease (patch repair protein)
MVDLWTPEKRSWVMSRIRGKNTKPERTVRSLLHNLGYRFTVNGPKNRRLPGKPDIVLPKHHAIILVHGCFWHGHEGCKHFRLPKTRVCWWREKIRANRERDVRNLAALEALGWNVLVIWECRIRPLALRESLAAELVAGISGSPESAARVAEDAAPYRARNRKASSTSDAAVRRSP